MAYTIEEAVEPFWAEFSSAASGRDPLAIQNSSVVIYSKMVVGITNVTNRIRYIGFFCWVFDTILQNIDKKNSLQEQIRYSRRAELLLAYLMVKNFPDITGVSGSSYASNNMEDPIDLKKGADWEFKQKGGKVFWLNSQGIFGQYYSGVTRVLNLINHPNEQLDLNIYTLTAKGFELAKAFAENIPNEESDLFWQSVLKGSIPESDLERLKSFALHLVPEGANERHFYQNAMLAADDRKVNPTFGLPGMKDARLLAIQTLITTALTYPQNVKVITAILRNDRFCDGVLASHFDSGLILKVLKAIQRQIYGKQAMNE